MAGEGILPPSPTSDRPEQPPAKKPSLQIELNSFIRGTGGQTLQPIRAIAIRSLSLLKSPTFTWIEINLSAVEDNIKSLRAIAGVPVMAVVKATAYGTGG